MNKHSVVFFIVFLVAVMTTSCGNKRVDMLLLHVDSVANKNPGIALSMADSIMRADSADMSTSEIMRLRLLRGRAQNAAMEPFKSDSIMRITAEYFDNHGTDYESMSAYYILGSVYRDLKDYPQALEYYHKALEYKKEKPDSLEYALLARVHGQIGECLLAQFALSEAEEEYNNAKYLFLNAKDTIAAVSAEIQIAAILDSEGRAHDGYVLRKKIKDLLLRKNLLCEASKALVPSVEEMLAEGKIDEVGKVLDDYDKLSGDVDQHGVVFNGGEYYYTLKGIYYLAKDSLSKARHYFEKGIKSTKDHSVREASFKGLLSLYKRYGNMDSIAKYSELACQENDSSYSCLSITQTQQLQAAYKSKEKFREYYKGKVERQRLWNILIVFVVVFVACIFVAIFLWYRQKTKEKLIQEQLKISLNKIENENKEHRKVLTELHKVEGEIEKLKSIHSIQVEQLIADKQKYVDELNVLKKQYDDFDFSKCEVVIYFKELANIKRTAASKYEWSELFSFVSQRLHSLYSLKPMLTQLEFEITILVKLGFIPSEIAMITGNSMSNISNVRKRLYTKMTGKQGTSKNFDEYVKSSFINS